MKRSTAVARASARSTGTLVLSGVSPAYLLFAALGLPVERYIFPRATRPQENRMTGELAVMGKSGDVKTMWNSDKPEEIKVAKEQFDALRAKGYAAFKTKKDGSKGEQIRAFDPEAEAIILAPPLVGG